VYPSVKKLAAMIDYYRNTPEPHWVSPTSLEFGEALPKEERKLLKPGACDGVHPEYTEAFDIAGMRAAGDLANAMNDKEHLQPWLDLAGKFFTDYDAKSTGKLAAGYGSYSVLWPCRLFPSLKGHAFDEFKNVGAQTSTSWRYFPLAKAHQGMLAGNRAAGFGTLANQLSDPQMQGWYAFDEGGRSGPGGWHFVRTTWNPEVAMPHGWAVAEMQLLLRDSLVLEEGKMARIFSGIDPEWLRTGTINIQDLPTHFGRATITWKASGTGADCSVKFERPENASALLQLPESLGPSVGAIVPEKSETGELFFAIPCDGSTIHVDFKPKPK
jgi:hypothetical protein